MEIAGLDAGALPSVLAIPLAACGAEDDPLLSLWHLCDATELGLRTLSVLALADWVAEGRGKLAKALVPEVASRIEQPTLGKWRGLVLALCRKPPAGTRIPELYDCVDTLDGIVRGTPGVESSLLELRNRLAHGGGMSRGMAARLAEAHGARLGQLAASLSWLSSWRFVAPGAGGALVGPTVDVTPCDEAALALARARTGGAEHAVAAVRGEVALGLWPFIQYGVPAGAGFGRAATRAVPMVYARRGEVRLALTPLGSDEVAMAESSEAAVEALVSLCARDEPAQRTWQVPGFEAELRRDAGQLVGRQRELERLGEVADGEPGAYWVTGPAGIGKSFLMAALAHRRAGDDAEVLTLGYRFKAGDPRTSRDGFLRFAVERVAAWRGADPPNPRRPLDRQLAELLAGDGRVVFVLDGVDELHAVDRRFAADVPLAMADRAVWICAGRAGVGLDPLFDRAVFEGGVPGLSADDVRAMLLAKIGPLSRKLLAGDDSDGAVNPFVNRVIARAGGLPLYVAYVIGDILSGRLTDLDAGADLPPSIDGYHRALLEGCAVGSVHQLLTPLVCALAVAGEPLPVAVLADLLIARGLVTDDDDGRATVHGAVAGAAAMLRRSDGEDDGPAAYGLFHQSLGEHVRTAAELAVAMATARAAMAAAAAAATGFGGATAAYLFRRGVAHMIDAGGADRAAALLADLDYLVARVEGGAPVSALVADIERVRVAGGVAVGFAEWAAQLTRVAHLIARRGATALVQAAIAHGASSPVSRAAEAWVAAGNLGGPWLRRVDRPEQPELGPCVRTFEGHERRVTDVAVAGNVAVSSGGDASLRVWDLDTGAELRALEENTDTLSFAMVTAMPASACLRQLDGHGWTVWSVAMLGDGRRVVAAHGDRTIKVWDADSGTVVRTLKGHEGYVWTVAVAGDRVLSAGDDRGIRVWDVDSGACVATLAGHDDWIAALAVTPDGRTAVSAGGDRLIRVWDLASGTCVHAFGGHKDYVSSLAISGDGATVVSGSGDGTVGRWELGSGRALGRWPAHASGVWSVAVCDRGLLSGGRDGLVHLWDEGGTRVSTLRGHAAWVWRVVGLPGGRALSASGDRTLKLWDLDLAAGARARPSHDGPVRSAAAIGDAVATVGADGALKLWDPVRGASLRTVAAHTGEARAVVACAGELVTIGADRALCRWAADGAAIERVELDVDPTALAVVGDRVVVGAADGAVAFHRGALLGAHPGGVTALASSHDGAMVASGGADGVIHVYDAGGTLRATLRGHTWDVQGLAFTGDGSRLVSASRDRSVMVWDPASGRRIATHADRHRGDSAALALLDGARVVSAADGKTVEVWNEDGAIAAWPGDATATAIVVLADGRLVIADVAGGITCLELSS